jgi:hypothetical protein
MHAIFDPKCKNAKNFFGKKSLNVLNVNLLSREIFNVFGVYYMLFCFKLYIKVNIYQFGGLLLVIA